MTREEADFIGAMNMCDEISNEAYRKIMCHCEEQQPCGDCVSREDAVNALRKALYKYEDETEKQFKESKELNLEDWFQHRIFVQNMNDIDIQTILKLPSVQQQPFINKPCISEGVCHEDKVNVLKKIRAEIIELRSRQNVGVLECLDIIDKYIEGGEKNDE